MTDERIAAMRRAIALTVDTANQMKTRHGLDPAAASQGARERAEGFTAGPFRPVLEATQIAELRLVVTAAHLEGVAALLDLGRPDSGYAISALSRTALESSARAGWLLDPRIDGRTRGLRGMAEMLYAFREEMKYPRSPISTSASARLMWYVAAVESAGLAPKPDSTRPGHFGDPRPSATDVIRAPSNAAGELAFRELSGVAHANLPALLRLTEVVSIEEMPEIAVTETERVSIAQPVLTADYVLSMVGTVLHAYTKSLDAKMQLFGWVDDFYQLRRVETSQLVVRLMRSLPGGDADEPG